MINARVLMGVDAASMWLNYVDMEHQKSQPLFVEVDLHRHLQVLVGYISSRRHQETTSVAGEVMDR